MLKIKSQNISLLTYIILFFCLVSLSTDLILTNKIFWGTLFILSFVLAIVCVHGFAVLVSRHRRSRSSKSSY